jgi:hypothetical protein
MVRGGKLEFLARLEQEEGVVEGEEQLLNISLIIIRAYLVIMREIISRRMNQ